MSNYELRTFTYLIYIRIIKIKKKLPIFILLTLIIQCHTMWWYEVEFSNIHGTIVFIL